MTPICVRWAAALALALTASACTITTSDPGYPERRDATISTFEDDLRRSEQEFETLAQPLSLSPATDQTRGIHAKADDIRDSIADAKAALGVFRTAQTEEEAQGEDLVRRLHDVRNQVEEFRRLAAFSIPVSG